MATNIAATVSIIAQSPTWDARVQRIRQIPEVYGLAQQARVYAAIAEQVYKPDLAPMFAHLPWREEYELAPFNEAYREAYEHTAGFTAAFAQTINRLVTGSMWGEAEEPLRPKLAKPDTEHGWDSVRRFAQAGVPFAIYLHQRFYGGAFGQLLNATSSVRGDLLELPVMELFNEHGILYLRTGTSDQAEIEARFGLTVRPAPDFVVFDETDALRAILECKQTNDGGTARDKAGRFLNLREEGARLGGVPVFGVVDGLGWRRTGDALGPVVRYTDGRVFTLATVGDMIKTQPFPQLVTEAVEDHPEP